MFVLALMVYQVTGTVAQESGNVIPFQGQLANQAGQPLSPTSPITFIFRLYRQAGGGISFCEESQPNFSVNAERLGVLPAHRCNSLAHL